LTTNFRDAPTPPEYLTTFIIHSLLGLIPAVWAGINRRKQSYLNSYTKTIDAAAAYHAFICNNNNKDGSEQRLIQIRLQNMYIYE
jgi:hypothetical protein